MERFSDETKRSQVEQHVEHEATGTRVSVRAADHYVPLRVHVAKSVP